MVYELVRLYRLRIEPQDNLDDIFISSDWHLGHDRQFIWGARGFANMAEHTEYIVNRAQELFANKYLILLGDNVWCTPYIDMFYEATKTCKKVFFLNGNHGPSQWTRPLRSNMVQIDSATVITGLIGYRYTPLTHYPIMPDNFNEFTNLCGHMHGSNGMYIYKDKCPTVTVDCGIDNSLKYNNDIAFPLMQVLQQAADIRKQVMSHE